MDKVLTLRDLRTIQRAKAEAAAFDTIPTMNGLLREKAEDISLDLSSIEITYAGKIHFSMQDTLTRIFADAGWNIQEIRDTSEEARPPTTLIKINWIGEPQ